MTFCNLIRTTDGTGRTGRHSDRQQYRAPPWRGRLYQAHAFLLGSHRRRTGSAFRRLRVRQGPSGTTRQEGAWGPGEPASKCEALGKLALDAGVFLAHAREFDSLGRRTVDRLLPLAPLRGDTVVTASHSRHAGHLARIMREGWVMPFVFDISGGGNAVCAFAAPQTSCRARRNVQERRHPHTGRRVPNRSCGARDR